MSLQPSVALARFYGSSDPTSCIFITAVCAHFEPQLLNIKWDINAWIFFLPPTVDSNVEASAFAADLIRYPCNAFHKPQEELKVNWRSAFGTATLVFSDVSESRSPAVAHFNSAASERGVHHKHSIHQGTTRPNYASGSRHRQSAELSSGEPAASRGQPSKKPRMDRGSFSGIDKAQNGAFDPGWVNCWIRHIWRYISSLLHCTFVSSFFCCCNIQISLMWEE